VNAASASSGLIQVGSPELRPRDANGWGPGAAISLGVHLMPVAALALGVHWKINNPAPIEAEVWAEIPKAAEPEPPPPPPVEEVKPVEKVAEATPAAEPEPHIQEPIPDLVVRKTPTKKERKKSKRHETVEVFETAPPRVAAKVDKKPEPKKPAPAPAQPVVSKVTKPDTSAKDKAEREAQRNAHLQRMMNELGSLGTSQSAGPSAAYGGRIKARIKPNIVFAESVSGNPTAVVEVRCGPDGRIISHKLIESSGVQSWDDAVQRAVERTEFLPRDEGGKVPPVMELTFRPNDF
jgi:colicin import membrane protein